MSGMAKPEWPDVSIPELVEWRGKVVAVPKTGSEIRRQGMWSQPIDSGGLEKVSRAAERLRFVRSPGPVSLRGRFKRFAWVGWQGLGIPHRLADRVPCRLPYRPFPSASVKNPFDQQTSSAFSVIACSRRQCLVVKIPSQGSPRRACWLRPWEKPWASIPYATSRRGKEGFCSPAGCRRSRTHQARYL